MLGSFGTESVVDMSSSYLVDETLPYVDAFLSKNWGLIDVCLKIQDKQYFPDRYTRVKPYSLVNLLFLITFF
jgi:hypothetical protein